MSSIVNAAGIVILARTEPLSFLLLKHKNRWDLPKGHAEREEDLQQTALRETDEETGIPAASIALDESFRYVTEYDVQSKKRGDYLKRVTYFLGFVEHQWEIKLTEHIGYRWLDWPPSKIQTLTIDPLLDAVQQHLNTN